MLANDNDSELSLSPWSGTFEKHCVCCPYDVSSEQLRGWPQKRMRLHIFLEEPSSSTAAIMWSVFIMLLIFVSVVSFISESYNSIAGWDGFFPLESVIVSIFTIELLLRMACSSNLHYFFTNWLNIIDIFAVLPYFIDLIGEAGNSSVLKVFRIVRLARVFRVFKVSRYASFIRIISNGILRSKDAFGILTLWLCMALLIFSTLMFYAERGNRTVDDVTMSSPFSSIPATFYWCIVTLTTIGFGDIVPFTPTGKLIACVCALCGILVIALPVTILGNNVTEVHQQQMIKQRKSKISEQIKYSEERQLQRQLLDYVKQIRHHRKLLTRSLYAFEKVLVFRSQFLTKRALTMSKRKRNSKKLENDQNNDIKMWQIVQSTIINGISAIENFLSTTDFSRLDREPLDRKIEMVELTAK